MLLISISHRRNNSLNEETLQIIVIKKFKYLCCYITLYHICSRWKQRESVFILPDLLDQYPHPENSSSLIHVKSAGVTDYISDTWNFVLQT